MNWIAIADILIAAFVIYQALVFIQGRRAMHMVVGVALAVLFFYFSRWTRLDTVSWLLSTILPYFVFLLIIVFQSEIRRALAYFGQTAVPAGISRMNRTESMEEIMLAVEKLAANKTGALIVIERNIGLKTYVESGVALDAVLSYDLLVTIFNHDLPLHDGAVIVQNNRIAAAACFLPLTVKPRLSKDLGTRHRAAIGITEETDALAIIVSEETGSLAFAHDGRIERGLGLDELRSKVREAFGAKRQAHAAVSAVETPVQGPVQGTDERPSAS
jgi:diadenylate cyclase